MEEGIRLNKYLSDAGVCSRREADRLIEAGCVQVDGKTASMGQRVLPGQAVVCNGKPVGGREKEVFLAVNKPRGIVCTTSDKDRAENIVEFLNYPVRIYPVGRLDKDSEGLLLMTNQGDLVNKILRAGNHHEKEYAVAVTRPVTEELMKKLQEGVWLEELGVMTKPCRAWKTGTHTFHIVLTQGLNRQIRRMCRALDYHVVNLKRVRIMNIRLGDLKRGEYRELTDEELAELKGMLRDSTNLPASEAEHLGKEGSRPEKRTSEGNRPIRQIGAAARESGRRAGVSDREKSERFGETARPVKRYGMADGSVGAADRKKPERAGTAGERRERKPWMKN